MQSAVICPGILNKITAVFKKQEHAAQLFRLPFRAQNDYYKAL